jgi:hypothetical protein
MTPQRSTPQLAAHANAPVGFSTLKRVVPINRKTNTSAVTDSDQSSPNSRRDYGAPWYGDYGPPWYGDYGDSTYVVPDEQSQPLASPTTEPPRRLGCSAQTYKVPSEAGGETSVKVWGC